MEHKGRILWAAIVALAASVPVLAHHAFSAEFDASAPVTLRGPVKTAEEKAKIEQLAKSAADAAKVDNQLEVKAADQK